MTSLSISTNWNENNYNFIFVIVDWLTTMVLYKPVKITIDPLGLAEVIINVIIWYYGLPDLIVTNKGLFFISKF